MYTYSTKLQHKGFSSENDAMCNETLLNMQQKECNKHT